EQVDAGSAAREEREVYTSANGCCTQRMTPTSLNNGRIRNYFTFGDQLRDDTHSSPTAQHFLSEQHYPVGFEPKLALKFLERRRCAEGLHTDDSAVRSDIPLPSKVRCLLDCDTGADVRG